MPLLVIITLLSLIVSAVLTLGTYRTVLVQKSPTQKQFLRGKVPDKMPEGIYKGNVQKIQTNWIGKEFSAANAVGVNHFKEGNTLVKKYPFKTYVGRGLQDRKTQVVKIDYNIPENPLWIRFILDEVVETEPNTLLGKIQVRFFPGIAFSLGYFQLTKK